MYQLSSAWHNSLFTHRLQPQHCMQYEINQAWPTTQLLTDYSHRIANSIRSVQLAIQLIYSQPMATELQTNQVSLA